MTSKNTTQMSLLIWLAIITAVVPFLAIPAWLTKLLVAGLSVTIAFLGYISLDHSDKTATSEKQDLPDNSSSSQPFDITDSEADRFLASNSYERRRQTFEK